MINENLSFSLPSPWETQTTFKTGQIGPTNFLVGPNGSGKSWFASILVGNLQNARLLGTDRLSGMEQHPALSSFFGQSFEEGFTESQFDYLKRAGKEGSGIDTIVLLEERMDLRIQVEATLEHLFNREITFSQMAI